MDDLSSSLEDIDKAYQLYLKSRERMTQGGFYLCKWLINSIMKKIQAMESQTEVSIKTERGNQFTEDDKTFNRVMVGRLEESGMSTPNRRSWELIGTISVMSSCSSFRHMSNAHEI